MKQSSRILGGACLAAFLYLSSLTLATANDVAYIRGDSPPWGESTNEAAMDEIFGAGNWADLRMADGAGPFQVGSGFRFIFLEGSDGSANELNAYLQAHSAQIEGFVSGGGRLLLNAAPNEGGNINFGFGGAELIYEAFTLQVVAADANHPVFQGPKTPVATAYTGNAFGHAILANGLTPIIIGAPGADEAGEIVLGEKGFGNGRVLMGGMTTNNFHSPSAEAANLRANIIFYAAEGAPPPPPVPVPSVGLFGLIALILLMLVAAGWSLVTRRTL